MQLLVLALMLMTMGKNTNMNELKPVFESLGGREAAEAFKQAEELSGMLSAVQSLTSGGKSAPQSCKAEEEECEVCGGYPLAPVAGIADERITYCLSRYIALGD